MKIRRRYRDRCSVRCVAERVFEEGQGIAAVDQLEMPFGERAKVRAVSILDQTLQRLTPSRARAREGTVVKPFDDQPVHIDRSFEDAADRR